MTGEAVNVTSSVQQHYVPNKTHIFSRKKFIQSVKMDFKIKYGDFDKKNKLILNPLIDCDADLLQSQWCLQLYFIIMNLNSAGHDFYNNVSTTKHCQKKKQKNDIIFAWSLLRVCLTAAIWSMLPLHPDNFGIVL